jgi:hypothetical protein
MNFRGTVVHTPYTVESIREYVDTQESTTILDVHAPRTPFCVLLCARILASSEYHTLSTVARRTTTVGGHWLCLICLLFTNQT